MLTQLISKYVRMSAHDTWLKEMYGYVHIFYGNNYSEY